MATVVCCINTGKDTVEMKNLNWVPLSETETRRAYVIDLCLTDVYSILNLILGHQYFIL